MPRRLKKAYGLNAKILSPFILSVTKKRITSRASVIQDLTWSRGDRGEIPEAGGTPVVSRNLLAECSQNINTILTCARAESVV